MGETKLKYWDKLKELNLCCLDRRRERQCIAYVWKVLHKLDLVTQSKSIPMTEEVILSRVLNLVMHAI